MPIRNIFDNGAWTSAEAIQQGLSVDVSCEDTPDSDHLVVWNQTILNPPEVEFQDALTSVSSCCNCTSTPALVTNFVWVFIFLLCFASGDETFSIQDNKTEYLNLAVCPFQWMNNTHNFVISMGFMP